jgi:hypothetical protein
MLFYVFSQEFGLDFSWNPLADEWSVYIYDFAGKIK